MTKFFKYGNAFFMLVDDSTKVVVRTNCVLASIEFTPYVVDGLSHVWTGTPIDEEEFVDVYREAIALIERNTGIYDIIKKVDDARVRRETIADDDYHREEKEDDSNN